MSMLTASLSWMMEELSADMTPDELLVFIYFRTMLYPANHLYVKAAKIRGCRVTEEMRLAHIETFRYDCKESLQTGLKSKPYYPKAEISLQF